MQAGAADAERQGCGDALLAADPDGPDPASQIRDLVSREASRRTTAASREEEEPGAFLVGMAEEAAVRIFSMLGPEFVHDRTLGPPSTSCLNIPGNYT